MYLKELISHALARGEVLGQSSTAFPRMLPVNWTVSREAGHELMPTGDASLAGGSFTCYDTTPKP